MRRYTAWLASVVLGALLLSGCAAPSSFFLLPEKKPAGSAAQESGEPGAAGASIAGLIGRDAEGEKGFETQLPLARSLALLHPLPGEAMVLNSRLTLPELM